MESAQTNQNQQPLLIQNTQSSLILQTQEIQSDYDSSRSSSRSSFNSPMNIPDELTLQKKRFRNLMYQKDNPKAIVTHRLFIFANPRSGSQFASKFLTIPQPDFFIQRKWDGRLEHLRYIQGHIFNVVDSKQRNRAFDQIKEASKTLAQQIVIVLMGGDGGLTHCIRTLQKFTNLDKLQFVSLPFGSGNDTAQVFGWGAKPDEGHLKYLSQICIDIVEKTKVEKLNIWEIKVTLNKKNSNVWSVDAQQNDVSLKKTNTFVIPMANYFSLGQCAKVGYDFERNRTGSKCCNELAYFCSGIKYMCFGCCCFPPIENIPIKDLIDYSGLTVDTPKQKANITSIQNFEEEDEEVEENLPEAQLIKESFPTASGQPPDSNFEQTMQKVLFATDRSRKSDFYLKGNPASLIATNVPSFMGGRSNPWIDAENAEMQLTGTEEQGVTVEKFGSTLPQSYNDGVLEFCAADTILNMLLKVTARVGQMGGPIVIKFRQQPGPFVVYLQIDGEFFKVLNPTSVTLEQAEWLNDGSINMLKKIK